MGLLQTGDEFLVRRLGVPGSLVVVWGMHQFVQFDGADPERAQVFPEMLGVEG